MRDLGYVKIEITQINDKEVLFPKGMNAQRRGTCETVKTCVCVCVCDGELFTTLLPASPLYEFSKVQLKKVVDIGLNCF